MVWKNKRAGRAVVGLCSLAIIAGACSSSSKSATNNSPGTTAGGSGGGSSASTLGPNQAPVTGLQIANPNSGGTPVTGGTLTVLGTSDVDNNLDPNVGYYTLDYLASLLYNRPLYAYPSIPGQTFTAVPDLATAAPAVSDNGLLYSVTIRTGAMWNTTPPRQVTAADVVLGVKRSCNPTLPFGGQPDFSGVLAGYTTFCDGFSKVSTSDAAAQAAYINANNISGVTVDPSNPLTVQFHLTKVASYFPGVLNLPPFNPAPVESLSYLPDSVALATHIPSDGPYQIKSYNPNTSIVFTRNSAWSQAADPVDKAYVNEIDISETGNQQGILQQIETNSPQADMQWDIGVPATAIPGLLHDPRLQLQTEGATNPYIIFNTISKNNAGALGNPKVRQALSYAIDRTELIQNHGGPQVDPPLTHLIAPGTDGSGPNFDDYPYDPAKAKQLLAAAGASNLTLTLLYRNQNASAVKDFQTLQANLAAVGVTLKGLTASNADFYGKYLVPGTAAKNSQWDLAEAGWGPDWYPSGGPSYFLPILSTQSVPPNGSNYGFFTDPTLDNLMNQALAASSENAAAAAWHQADVEAMAQASVYPIADPNSATIHGSQVHNCVFVGPYQNCNLANVWVSS
ncbi:MAG: ABC transporter substrate-binding protein [Acidobacteriota bacterium]|nr:ABC transporter substrate-binding protein [Acidobacteriota bacterium]